MVARSGGPTKDARDGVVDKELLGAFRSQNPKHVEERARYFKPVPGLANQRIQCKECAGGTKFFDGLGELFGHCKSIQEWVRDTSLGYDTPVPGMSCDDRSGATCRLPLIFKTCVTVYVHILL